MSTPVEKFSTARTDAKQAVDKLQSKYLVQLREIEKVWKQAEREYINTIVIDQSGQQIRVDEPILYAGQRYKVSGFVTEKDTIKIELRKFSNTHPPKLGKTIYPVEYKKADDFEIIVG